MGVAETRRRLVETKADTDAPRKDTALIDSKSEVRMVAMILVHLRIEEDGALTARFVCDPWQKPPRDDSETSKISLANTAENGPFGQYNTIILVSLTWITLLFRKHTPILTKAS